MLVGHNSNLKLCYDNSKASSFSGTFYYINKDCDELSYMDNIYIFSSDMIEHVQRIIII